MKRKIKGSATIEAGIWIPIVFAVYFMAIHLAGYGYREMKEEDISSEISSMWEVENFYRYHQIEGVMDDK